HVPPSGGGLRTVGLGAGDVGGADGVQHGVGVAQRLGLVAAVAGPAGGLGGPQAQQREAVQRRHGPTPGGRAVTTLNRFPLLGLWATEAARRAGYRRDEAEALGHAYAVLYAIRAAHVPRTEADCAQPAARRRHV